VKKTIWLTSDNIDGTADYLYDYETHFSEPIWDGIMSGWVSNSYSNVRTSVAHHLYPPCRKWKGGPRSCKRLEIGY